MYHEFSRACRQAPLTPRAYRLGKRADAAEDTRRRILDAARELITEAGFHPVSVEEVAARAGASRPTVYRHFGSKPELLEAVAWDVVAAAGGLDRLDEARHLPDVVEALHRFLRENCLLFSEIGEALRITLNVARDEPEVARILDITYYGRRVESLEHLAGRLDEEGALAPGWTPERATEALMILTNLETFETLTLRRGYSPIEAADVLVAMTQGFVR